MKRARSARTFAAVLLLVATLIGIDAFVATPFAYSSYTTSGNLLANDATAGDNAFFNVTIGSWASLTSGATLSHVDSPAQSDVPGALAVTTNDAGANNSLHVYIASGSGPSDWTPASAGLRYTATTNILASSKGENVAVVEIFYDGSGTTLASAWGQLNTDTSTGWTATTSVVGIAPAGTAYVSLGLVFYGTATNEVHYVDTASITATNVNPTPITPPFHTSGNAIYGADGARVTFRGIQREGSEVSAAGFPTDAEIAQARVWGANLIRVPLNESLWLNTCPKSASNLSTYPSLVDTEVNRITSRGMLAVLDLHLSVGGLCGKAAQQPMADAQYSPKFWSALAGRYKNNPLVAFDLYNEPHDISDSVWLNGGTATYAGISFKAEGMQQLYNAVRAQGAANLVFTSGNNWAVQPAAKLVSGTNIVNAVHAYTCANGPPPGCQTPDYYNPNYILSKWVTLGASQPVMVTEFGWPDKNSGIYNGNVIATAESQGWGWNAFAWDGSILGTFDQLASIGSTYEPSPAGMPVLTGLFNN